MTCPTCHGKGIIKCERGVDFLKHWKDSGNLTAAVALGHFGKPYDIIRKAVGASEGDA